jgi:hypothetical protein
MSSIRTGVRLLLLAVGLCGAAAATAQGVFRSLPEDARRGYLTFVGQNVVTLDSKQMQLAPGAQIRGANNLIVMPAALPGNSLVKYQLDGEGNLFRAWVLTAQEAAQPDKYAPQRLPWATSPEVGRSIDQLLGNQPENRIGLRPGEQRPTTVAPTADPSTP